ncbi:MAG: alkaline phosphatase [Acidobacteria bacterium]|nr:MAG: alkaline phosphatase [Acidobacteriota bacterium]
MQYKRHVLACRNRYADSFAQRLRQCAQQSANGESQRNRSVITVPFDEKEWRLGVKKTIAVLCCALLLVLGLPTGSVRAQTQDVVFAGAGDIARCGPDNLFYPQATAALLDSIPGSVFAIGDLAYVDGLETESNRCFDATCGRHRAAGDPTKGYYSFNYGAWHVVVLNSVCTLAPTLPGGCTATSPEGQWLQADLAANPTACTAALWHTPLYTSTSANATPAVQPFWQILYNGGADLVINGHAHNYERFAPQDPNGNLDAVNGIREFVVGTGGESLMSFGTTIAANSEVRNSTTHGVIQFTLHATSYDWQFIPVAGQTFTDSGTQACH